MRTSDFRRALACFLVAAALLVSGCTPRSSPDPSPAPPEPFGEFAVGEFGGVDGRQNILRVRPDGTALLISREPAAGRLGEAEMLRLRTLLTSEQFRLEAARGGGGQPDPPSCTDQIITEVRMGSLSVTRSGPCGEEDASPAPAFEEILTIVAPARQGVFTGPVEAKEPRLVPLRLERVAVPNQPAYVVTVDAAGRASRIEADLPTRSEQLTAGQRDTLRLLLPLLDEGPVPSCDSPEYYRLRIGDGDVRPDCSVRGRYPEYRAVVALLDEVFRQ